MAVDLLKHGDRYGRAMIHRGEINAVILRMRKW